MADDPDAENLAIARRWCASRGAGWAVLDTVGRGGTAPVFSISSPDGPLALKILDLRFSEGELGKTTEARVAQQVSLGRHGCPYLVETYDGGRFEDRLFLLMNRAPGQELEKRLHDVPRNKVRLVVDQIAKACIFLRERGICHRDIKSANIFLTDDFSQATLLDLSVTREIRDPVGVGTDHSGQLPVVATSRYSPPEYLFRLIDPSPELWHALDVYQLGGLLHDLIMQEPMFEAEYRLSQENRYRFAWIVATVDPVVSAADVDFDLILLARRALDKNWNQRSQLRLEDFLDKALTRRERGLSALGVSPIKKSIPQQTSPASVHRRVAAIAKGLERSVLDHLQRNGVKASHTTTAGPNDASKNVVLNWSARDSTDGLGNVELVLALGLSEQSGLIRVGLSATLSATVDGTERTSSLVLPETADTEDVVDVLAANIAGVLGELAVKVMRAEGS